MRNTILMSAMVLALAACGGGDKTDAVENAAAEGAAAVETAAADAVEAVETAAASAATDDSAYVTACMSHDGDRATCACADDVYKAELNDELYELTLVSLQGNEAKAAELMMAYATGAGAETMAEDMQRAAEAVVAKCGG